MPAWAAASASTRDPLYVGGLQPGLVAGALFAGQMDHGLHADQCSLYAAAV
jgi:hypothetical protein